MTNRNDYFVRVQLVRRLHGEETILRETSLIESITTDNKRAHRNFDVVAYTTHQGLRDDSSPDPAVVQPLSNADIRTVKDNLLGGSIPYVARKRNSPGADSREDIGRITDVRNVKGCTQAKFFDGKWYYVDQVRIA